MHFSQYNNCLVLHVSLTRVNIKSGSGIEYNQDALIKNFRIKLLNVGIFLIYFYFKGTLRCCGRCCLANFCKRVYSSIMLGSVMHTSLYKETMLSLSHVGQ